VRAQDEPDTSTTGERCLPGLGWVLRESGGAGGARSTFGKAEEEEEEEEAGWRVLFADGEELRLQLRLRRRQNESRTAGAHGAEERGEAVGEGDDERCEVELRWRGKKCVFRSLTDAYSLLA